MAKLVFTDAYFAIGATDLSDHVRSITVNYEAEEVDATCMGDGARNIIAGFLSWSVDVTFAQDFAAGEVDATLFPLVGSATASTLHVRPVNSAIAADNPEYTGDARLFSYPPMGGGVGDFAETSVSFKSAGTLARDVEP